MSGAITAVAVGGYLSNKAAKKQQEAAANAQAQALGYQDAAQQRNIEEQQRQFDLTRQDTATQRAVGDKALNYLSQQLLPGSKGGRGGFGSGRGGFLPTGSAGPQTFQMGDFKTDPGYDFRLQQGAQARGNALGAGGMKLSGRAQKELERYGQDYGSQEYANVYARRFGEFQQAERDKQNYLARQMQLAGYGGQGINTAASAGQSAAANISQGALGTGANMANIATQYGADTANIAGQNYANQANAISGGIQNYLALQQQQRQSDLFNSRQAGDAYMPAYDPNR